jgi:hypothetical protein
LRPRWLAATVVTVPDVPTIWKPSRPCTTVEGAKLASASSKHQLIRA